MGARAMSLMRLQKFLSDAGVASRRHAEELILEGRVLVNDEIVDSLPAFVDPAADRVIVDGSPVRAQRLVYFIAHKPTGVVCTDRDPAGRTRAVDLIPAMGVRLFVVGRLDVDSSGLLLMTNDGELAARVTHPRFGVRKVYRADVRGEAPSDVVARLKKGVFLAEGRARAAAAEVLHRSRETTAIEITLREGRNRQVRRMLARMGMNVRRLRRIRIGPLTIKGLGVGGWRELTKPEIDALRREVAGAEGEGAGAANKRGKPRRRGERATGSEPVVAAASAARPRRIEEDPPKRRRRIVR